MSRIGKMPVVIPAGVEVSIADGVVKVKGPKGQLQERLHPLVRAEVKDGKVVLSADLSAAREASAVYGMSRARVNNMVAGVSAGFAKMLSIVGLGFRGEVEGQKLTLSIGKSHPVPFTAPAGIVLSMDPKKTLITVTGASKDLVGETAAKIRDLRPPEPYKGTGIRYQGEYVRKKAGKTAAGAAGTAGASGAGAAKK